MVFRRRICWCVLLQIASTLLSLRRWDPMERLATTIMTKIPKRVPIPRNGVDYRGKIVLAPMVRSGELPSRLLALHYGADLVWGPETIDRAIIATTRQLNPALSTIDFVRLPMSSSKDTRKQKETIIYRLHPSVEHKRLIFQLGTSNPDLAVAAARLVAADVAGIDVNAGCPKPFSTSGGMGAALLRTPDKLCAILEALVKTITSEFEIGISVKIRLLETPEMTESLVRKLCATGITGLTVHCRTTPMRPRERAIREQLRMIAGVCNEAGVACLMNGDVTSRDQAEELISEFEVDGAMIATAAETNPSCFRTKAEGGLAPWREVVQLYLEKAMEVDNRWGNTKYLLGQMIPGKNPVYRGVLSTKNYFDICKVLDLQELLNSSKVTSENLESGVDEAKGVLSQAKSKNQNQNRSTDSDGVGIKRKRSLEKEDFTPRNVKFQYPASTLSV